MERRIQQKVLAGLHLQLDDCAKDYQDPDQDPDCPQSLTLAFDRWFESEDRAR